MVGVGTVLADNPRLTVRLVEGTSPHRVIVDSTLRLPLEASVLSDGASPTLVATTSRAPAERIRLVEQVAQVEVVATDATGGVDLDALLRRLVVRGLSSVLVEGGSRLITAFLRRRLVDRLVVCVAPMILGTGTDAVGDLGIDVLGEAITFESVTFTPLGRDVIFDGRYR